MNLNSELSVITLANDLGLDINDPVVEIRAYCRKKVRKFLRGFGRVTDAVQLQKIVCAQLNLTVHEVWSDDDLNRLADSYVNSGEIIFKTLAKELSPDAFGVLLRLKEDVNGRPCFAAVIDCRGDKKLRRYWTVWHEIAHALTYVDQEQLSFRRTTIEPTAKKEPIEQITDLIASDFAFYKELFFPILIEEMPDDGVLTFDTIETIRQRFNPGASFLSTASSCVKAVDVPIILLEVGLGYKKSEIQRIEAGETGIQPSLRVMKSIVNDAANAEKFFIPKRMRVPENSVIADAHRLGLASKVWDNEPSLENLVDWTTSSGRGLPDANVIVEAQAYGENTLALISAA